MTKEINFFIVLPLNSMPNHKSLGKNLACNINKPVTTTVHQSCNR